MFGKILYTLFTRFFATLMQGAVIIMASHFYGPEGKGEIALLHSDIFLLLLGSQLLGGLALVYHSQHKNPFQLYLISTLWNLAVVSIGLPYVLQISSAHIWSSQFLWWLAFIQAGISTHQMLLLGQNKVTAYNRILITQAILTFCTLIVMNFYFPRASSNTYLYALVASWALTWFISFMSITYLLKPWSFKQIHLTFKDLFLSGLPIQFMLLIEFVLMKGQLYLMSIRDTSPKQISQIGIFSNAISVAEAIGIITISIALVEYAGLSKITDLLIKRKKGVRIFRSGMIVSALLLTGVWLLPENFYSYLFGQGFGGMKNVVRIMIPGIFGLAITRILGAYYFSSGRSWIPMVGSVCGVLISLLLFYNDTQPQWEATGAAYSFTIAYSLSGILILSAFFVLDKIKLTDLIPDKEDFENLKEQIKEMKEPRDDDRMK